MQLKNAGDAAVATAYAIRLAISIAAPIGGCCCLCIIAIIVYCVCFKKKKT
jgi:hypothetical protein